MPGDLYFVLGVPRDATLQEIKSAYRQRALALHPDQNGGEGGPFRDLQQAYDVLSDPRQRSAYDDSLRQVRRRADVPADEAVPFPESFARGLAPTPEPFSYGHVTPIGPASAWPNPRPSGLLSVPLTPSEARFGGDVRVLVPLVLPCPRCRGEGSQGFGLCFKCEGWGGVEIEYPVELRLPPGMAGRQVRISFRWMGLSSLDLYFHPG